MDATKKSLADRQVTWFARYVAALASGNHPDAADCQRQLATLGIWVEASSRIFADAPAPLANA
ncbi:MAG: hypothetical protein ACKVHE_32770 [Planctomycetales bacterium]|jgi:hypothetical protein